MKIKTETYTLPAYWAPYFINGDATGYGNKIPTSKKIRILGRAYRIYCTIFPNAGKCWINLDGKKVIIP